MAKPNDNTIQISLPVDTGVSYIDTVQAYDQWADVSDRYRIGEARDS